MTQLPQHFEEQISTLATRYGQPFRAYYNAAEATCLIEKRAAEILPVIQRPDGRILLMTKGHYPNHIFRLPTGGLEAGEQIEVALWREVAEETGLDVEVERFLSVISYERAAPQPPFTTYAFLLRELGGTLACNDPDEDIFAFHAVYPHELPAIADRLRALPPHTYWKAWGNFRALSHDLIARLLVGAAVADPHVQTFTGR